MARRAALSAVLAAMLLVAVNATSAFAATTSGTGGEAGASSSSTTATTGAPSTGVASTTTPAPTPSATTPPGDASPPVSTQAASVVHAAALATDIVTEPHPDPPQPPLTDNSGSPLLGVSVAGTPYGAGAVTYGGVSITGSTSSAASWVWNGTSWSQVCAVCAPGVRGFGGIATDLASATTGVVLYGGEPSFGAAGLSDAWVFADGAWTQLCASCPPGARLGQAMAGGGAAGDQVLLFGGASDFTGNPGTFFNDTWGFDGTTWSLLDPGVAGDPAPRLGASMAWDGTRFILFGGATPQTSSPYPVPIDDGTWAWAGDHWVHLCANAAACGPPARTIAVLAPLGSTDPSRRGVLLVGGFTPSGTSPTVFGDIWLWRDGQWIQQVSPWVAEQPLLMQTGPVIIGGGVASLSASCEASVVGVTALATVSTWNLGLDTNGDGVIDPCPVVPPPAPPAPENVAPVGATAGAAEATASGTLPFTGRDLTGATAFATVLLAVGLVFVVSSRRTNARRRQRSRVSD